MREKSNDETSKTPPVSGPDRRSLLLSGASLLALSAARSAQAQQAQQPSVSPQSQARASRSSGGKPNILFIYGDDIGIANLSAYSSGLMGYETPNIDRIAKEGLRFQHYYGEQSCTAGRAAFLTGQHG